MTGRQGADADNEEASLPPQASLELIEREGRQACRQLGVDPAPIFGLWGVAWLLGWGAIYLASPGGPGPLLPMWAAGVILGVLYAAAIVLPIVRGVQAGRGVSGPSRVVGAMYGWSWTLGFCALTAINVGLMQHGLSDDTVSLLWSGTASLVIGLLYLAGGMLWRDRVQYLLGVWMLLTAAGSVFAGVPGDFAVLALAGGGGFLVQCAYYLLVRHAEPS
ncbi:MAG: hypothetical protein ACRDSH_17680 [Pseudonocardiaceae bacterium]